MTVPLTIFKKNGKTDGQLCSKYTCGIFLGFLWELKYAEPTEN